MSELTYNDKVAEWHRLSEIGWIHMNVDDVKATQQAIGELLVRDGQWAEKWKAALDLLDGPNAECATLRAEVKRVTAERDEAQARLDRTTHNLNVTLHDADVWQRLALEAEKRGDQYRNRALALLQFIRNDKDLDRTLLEMFDHRSVELANAEHIRATAAEARAARLSALLRRVKHEAEYADELSDAIDAALKENIP